MYGKFIEGMSQKNDKYGFVNENQVRIEAGFGLLIAIYSSISIIFFAEFTIPTILILLMWIDFISKIFISPQASLFAPIAKHMTKETQCFVGAVQKRFAWSVGLFLSTFVLFCVLILSGKLNSIGILTEVYTMAQELPIYPPMAIPMNPAIIACILCVIFMTAESIFGYCVGCKMYQKLVQWGVMKKIKGQNCAGGVCNLDD